MYFVLSQSNFELRLLPDLSRLSYKQENIDRFALFVRVTKTDFGWSYAWYQFHSNQKIIKTTL